MTKKTKHRELNAIVGKIVREFKPEKIILFGSYAWGNPGPDSDVDLLVIKRSNQDRMVREMHLRKMLWGSPIPLDLLVYTPNEVQKKIRDDSNLFLEDIVQNGVTLYAHK